MVTASSSPGTARTRPWAAVAGRGEERAFEARARVAGASREWNHRRRRPLAIRVGQSRCRITRPTTRHSSQAAGRGCPWEPSSTVYPAGRRERGRHPRVRGVRAHAAADGIRPGLPLAVHVARVRSLARPKAGHPAARNPRARRRRAQGVSRRRSVDRVWNLSAAHATLTRGARVQGHRTRHYGVHDVVSKCRHRVHRRSSAAKALPTSSARGHRGRPALNDLILAASARSARWARRRPQQRVVRQLADEAGDLRCDAREAAAHRAASLRAELP